MVNRPKNLFRFLSCIVLLLITHITTLKWMVERWFEAESYYGHGFLIPVVSAVIIWQRRAIFKKADSLNNALGIAIVAVSLFLHIIFAGLRVYFVSGFLMISALYGLIIYFFGRNVARGLTFPVFFLTAMIPLPLVLIGNLTVKMKLFAAQAATFVLNKIGFPSIRDGSLIRMPKSFIAIEAPCSGLRSMISLLTLGLLFSYASKVSYFKKGILFLSSVPIALGTNILRIIMLATVNDLYGEKIAMGFFHDFSGFLVFALAFAALIGVSRALEPKNDEAF